MESSSLYPIGLNLTGKSVLVIGGGTKATHEVERLLQHPCFLTIISPELQPQLQALTQNLPETTFKYLKQWYNFRLLEFIQPDLVFACTNDAKVNQQITDNAKRLGIWVHCVTESTQHSDFMVTSPL